MNPYFLIGAGGHAATIVEIASMQGLRLQGYNDPKPASWIAAHDARQLDDATLEALLTKHPQLVMGFVGLNTESLQRRMGVMVRYTTLGAQFPPIIHPQAIISPSARIGGGVQILGGAVVNAHAVIGDGAIINSGAVIEHHAHIGAGSHIAPRASVLGNAHIGECAFVGAGAVVIQGQRVAAAQFVRALSVFTGQEH